MLVTITRTTPIYRSQADHGVFLQWTVDSAPPSGVSEFTIERSGSSEGPFELVIDHIKDYHFFDNLRSSPLPHDSAVRENLNFLSLSRSVYYKVTAHTVDGSRASTIRSVSADLLSKKIALLRRKMQRDLVISFKFNGIQLAVLKRRHWGIRCKDCFDVLTKRVTKTKCNSCYGTGFEGGYFNPVCIKGRIGVESVQTDVTPQDKAEINQKRLTVASVPAIEVDDIIVDIAQNKRYIVKHKSTTELQTVWVHQQLVISELGRDSVEFRIPINLDYAPVIY